MSRVFSFSTSAIYPVSFYPFTFKQGYTNIPQVFHVYPPASNQSINCFVFHLLPVSTRLCIQNLRMKHLISLVLGTLLHFGIIAQSACDSVLIHSLNYDLFHSDSLIEVVVKNESSVFFNYPALVLLDANGDTVASEDVNFFGLGNYYQGHTLTLHEPLNDHIVLGGQLVLTGMNESVYCTWEDDYDLCGDSCSKVRIVMQGSNFPSDSHTYVYDVVDSNANVVAHDTMHLDSAHYTAWDTACLVPGNYSIVWERLNSETIEPLHFRVDALYTYTGPLTNNSAQTASIQFDMMRACIDSDTTDSTLSVPINAGLDHVSFGCNDQCILIQNSGSNRMLGVRVFDLHGRLIHQSTSTENFQQIPIRQEGIYLVQVQTEGGSEVCKVLKY